MTKTSRTKNQHAPQQLVEREWARYDDARVRSFVPVPVRRAVIGDVLAADAHRALP